MSRITRFLIPVSWTLWGILLLVLLWVFVDSIVNPVYTPEVSPQVGPMVMGALLIVFVGFGLLLRWAARRRSTGCLIALTLMLAYVFFMLIAILVFEAWNDWQVEREVSASGTAKGWAENTTARNSLPGSIPSNQRPLDDDNDAMVKVAPFQL